MIVGAASEGLRVGILGAGGIADFHVRAVQAIPGLTLVAVCDQQAARAEAFREKWGIPKTFDSLPKMLGSAQPDVVHVLVPPAAHAATAIASLDSGAHVFVEKPLAASTAECQAMAAAAARNRRKIGVNHNVTFSPGVLRVLEAVEGRRLGRVEHVTAFWNLPMRGVPASHWIYQGPRNILLELAPHPVSLIQLFVGEVRCAAPLVCGEQVLASGIPFYETWQASLNCARGTGQLFFSAGRDYLETWVHVIGQDGSAFVDLRRNTVWFSEKSPMLGPFDDLRHCAGSGAALWRGGLRNFRDYLFGVLRFRPAYDLFSGSVERSVHAFYAALREGVEPRVGLREGAAIVDACERISAGIEVSLGRSA